MEPLLMAFAKAAQNMPALEQGVISYDITNPDEKRALWEVSYFAPGTPASYRDTNEDDIKWRRIFYETNNWFPRKEVEYELLKIGREVHGEAVLERAIDMIWG